MMLPIGKSSFVVRRTSYVVRKRDTRYAIRNTRKGFTLIEVMLSVTILSIGLVLILQGFTHSLNALRISEDNLKATFMAGNKFAEAQIQAKEDWGAFKSGVDEKFDFENVEYAWEVEIAPVVWDKEDIPEEYETLNEVKATLTWKEGKREGGIPLITYMKSVENE